MKKIKKILLAFVPLTAIAIATPIVLTACSDTTTNNANPDNGENGEQKPGEDNNQKPVTPSFTKDETNSDSFQLDASTDAQKILEKYKAAQGVDAATKILTDELANFPKQGTTTLAKDVLKMWSNNNWFAINSTAKDENVKKTFISSLTINKAEVGTDSKATFDVEYKSAFIDSAGKLYEAKQLLKADKIAVDSTTKIEINKELPSDGYKINGEIQTLPQTSLLASESNDPQTNLETFLKLQKLSLDAKTIFESYIKNHGIKHAEKPAVPNLNIPTWNEAKVKTKKGLSIDSANNKNVILQLDANANTDWGSINETHPYNTIKEAVFTNRLVSVIKPLIDFNDYKDWNTSMGAEVKGQNNKSYAVITIKFIKKDNVEGNDTSPIFTFTINGFKSSAN